jgi:membrane fusion protein, adhesin transport system
MTDNYLSQSDVGKSSIRSRQIIWLIVCSVVIFFIWASFAPIKEVVRGVGRIVPRMQTQVIQNLEGGIVQEILVAEGDIVERGQRVAKMNETQFMSAYQELQEQRLALFLKLQRLSAELDPETDFEPESELVIEAPEYASSEISLFEARREQLSSTTKTLREAARLRRKEVEMLRPMAERFAVPEIELLRAEQAAVDSEGRVLAVQNEFEANRSQEYSETLVQLRQTEEQIRAKQDQLRRTDVVSPVRGIVNKVSATTIGGVVRPGDPLIEILPLDETLRVEGRVDPKDIGFVFVGMPAVIKLTAFDFSIFGSLKGKLVHVGADTVVDEAQREQRPYYEVFIELETTSIQGRDGMVEVRPGMQAEIELESGERTVLQYLLKPLFKATEAFSER